jgi:hypothetical protein
MWFYETALSWKELEGNTSETTIKLIKNISINTVEYSLRQLYADYVGAEWGSTRLVDRGLMIVHAIGFPAWIEFEDRKPKVEPCVDKLINILLEDAGRDHIILL